MAQKTLKTRVVNKHDIEANWNLATSFYPMKGEVIVYDAETADDRLPEGRTTRITYERMKIGDGVNLPIDLPFVDEEITKKLDEKVDKVAGKDLSSNDYTNAEKVKLQGIEEGATKVEVDRRITNDSENPVRSSAIYTALKAKADLKNGKIPSDQLPSYVDDVLEYDALSNFPSPGESGKIYVETSTNKTYRWSGSQYIEISNITIITNDEIDEICVTRKVGCYIFKAPDSVDFTVNQEPYDPNREYTPGEYVDICLTDEYYIEDYYNISVIDNLTGEEISTGATHAGNTAVEIMEMPANGITVGFKSPGCYTATLVNLLGDEAAETSISAPDTRAPGSYFIEKCYFYEGDLLRVYALCEGVDPSEISVSIKGNEIDYAGDDTWEFIGPNHDITVEIMRK